jgi:hypothetical protein
MYQFITQAIGFVATGLEIGSYQCKKSRNLIYVQLCANIAFLIHLLMLGAYSGCASLVVSCIRNFIFSSNRAWAYWKGWPWVLVAANIIGAILTWESVFSILPCIGVVAITLSCWTRNGKKIRIATICFSSPSWLIYAIYTGSYSAIVTELFILCSVGLSIVRYGWKALDVAE